MSTEADTCRKYVLPRLLAAGWDTAPHSLAEQRTFTDGRIVVAGNRIKRRPQKRADYILRYTRDLPIAVVEAKREYATPGAGLQQAKEYAEVLGLKFAYATNGHGIVEFDYITGRERLIDAFPTPDELWQRLKAGEGLNDDAARRLITPLNHATGKPLRYYQEIAVHRAVQAILQGRRRVLLTMATGTGKTLVAFQVCWKLWSGRWNRTGDHRHPRILFLADRAILVDDPHGKDFAPFGEARYRIENGEVSFGREMYFATYQAIARDERRPGLYREFAPDFFDLIVVDECHRGSARDDSNWREILEYFDPAYQLGMTATPRREENRDTYAYFGDPVYTYSLRQGIEDGFLAPYRVHRVVTDVDAAGWRPSQGEVDRYGREIPDRLYGTPEFERSLALRARTEAIARHLTDFLKKTDRMAKTIVFCVDQEHAEEMRRALTNLNADLVKRHPDYVCRVTADEGEVGRGHLSRFQELETPSPVILTTSQLLTTGVDAPMVKNVVIARMINSMVEFKQIIGRGTRVRDDYNKWYFNIIDYTGSATRLFADPEFDGDPAVVIESELDERGRTRRGSERVVQPEEVIADAFGNDLRDQLGERPEGWEIDDGGPPERRKYYVDGGEVEIAAHLVYELDADGKQLRVVSLTDYTGEKVRTLYSNAAALRADWADPGRREAMINALEERGVDFAELAAAARQPEADPFDLLCHVAFHVPTRTRRERAERVRREESAFFEQYAPEARAVLEALLEKYAEHGAAQFKIPDVLKVPPLSHHGNPVEIAACFGGADSLRQAVYELQNLIYAA